MDDFLKIIEGLSAHQKEILQKAREPGATILFNIKGMVQVLHAKGPFDFIELGYNELESLKNKGLICTKRSMQESILQGEEFILTSLGQEVANHL